MCLISYSGIKEQQEEPNGSPGIHTYPSLSHCGGAQPPDHGGQLLCGYGDSSLAHPWAQGVQSALVATTCGSVRPTVAPGKNMPSVGTKTSKFTEGRVARKHKCFQQKVTGSIMIPLY